jgi:hypothetical protein
VVYPHAVVRREQPGAVQASHEVSLGVVAWHGENTTQVCDDL